MNLSQNPAMRAHDPFDDSATERQKRMGLLSSEGVPCRESIAFFCTLYAGLFFDDLCDSCGDYGAALAVCRRLVALSQKEEPRRVLLALSVQYDAMHRGLPDPIWWIAGNPALVAAFAEGFCYRLHLLACAQREVM